MVGSEFLALYSYENPDSLIDEVLDFVAVKVNCHSELVTMEINRAWADLANIVTGAFEHVEVLKSFGGFGAYYPRKFWNLGPRKCNFLRYDGIFCKIYV